MKNKTVKLRKIVCRAIVFSPKIKTVKIGEMLRSKLSAVEVVELSSPEKLSAEPFIFVLNTKLSKEEKSSA